MNRHFAETRPHATTAELRARLFGRESLPAELEQHVLSCADCREHETLLSAGQASLRTFDQQHRSHASRISEEALGDWLSGTLSSQRALEVDRLAHSCPVCFGLARQAGEELEDFHVSIDWSRLSFERLQASLQLAAAERGRLDEPLKTPAAEQTLERLTAPARSWWDGLKDWFAELSRSRVAYGLAAAMAVLLVVIPTALRTLTSVNPPDERAGIKGAAVKLDLKIEADVMVPEADGSSTVALHLDSLDYREEPCPANAHLRLRAEALGSGSLSVWRKAGSKLELIQKWPSNSYGGKRFNVVAPDGTRTIVALEDKGGTQNVVAVLSSEEPPATEQSAWLDRVLAGSQKDAVGARVACLVVK